MNDLSWMLYAAEVLDSLRTAFKVGAFAGTILVLGLSAFYAMCTMDEMTGFPAGCWKKPFRWIAIPIFLFVTAAFMPSSSTIYLIAASEAGETVVTSPDAMEMLNDLKSIIKQKLKRELGDQT
jgi:hypothetical protein